MGSSIKLDAKTPRRTRRHKVARLNNDHDVASNNIDVGIVDDIVDGIGDGIGDGIPDGIGDGIPDGIPDGIGDAPSRCSPARYANYKTAGSCLMLDDLVAIANRLDINIDPTCTTTTTILDRIHSVMGTKSGEETYWIASPAVRTDAALSRRLREAFRPVHPSSWITNPSMWLSTTDIRSVLEQYELSHPHFALIGVFPRDFATLTSESGRTQCISPPMCELSVAMLRSRDKSEFGIVFNMDRHDQSGSHWTACYGCIDDTKSSRLGIWYYDSVGRAPPVEIKRFMVTFANDAKASGLPHFPVGINDIRKQFENNECGVYAVFFIVTCLTTDYPSDYICSTIMTTDSRINDLRSVFFRPPKTAADRIHTDAYAISAARGVAGASGASGDASGASGDASGASGDASGGTWKATTWTGTKGGVIQGKEKATKEKATKEKNAIEGKATKEKATKEKANVKTTKDKATNAKTTKEKANVKTTKEKATKEKATRGKATKGDAIEGKVTKEKATKEKATKEKATKEKATKGKATKENAIDGKTTKEKATKEKVTKEKATKEKVTKEKATKGKATKEKATKGKATKGKATKEKATKRNTTTNGNATKGTAANAKGKAATGGGY